MTTNRWEDKVDIWVNTFYNGMRMKPTQLLDKLGGLRTGV